LIESIGLEEQKSSRLVINQEIFSLLTQEKEQESS